MSAPSYRLVYIAGTGRSGSTLVAQCLANAGGGTHAGELRYLWQRGVGENHLCECGAPFDRCAYWTEVLRKAYGAGTDPVAQRLAELAPQVDRIRRIPQAAARAGTRYRRHLREYGQLVLPLYDAIAAVSGADLVVDSSKDPSYLFALAALDALDLRVLHLVRDSRAVAYSWTRKRRRPEIHWQEQYMKTLPPGRAALIWLEYNSAIELYRRRNASSCRLHYEDFARQPVQAIRSVGRSLACAVDADILPGATTGHSLSGNPMRFSAGPLVIRPDTEWATGLPVRDQRVVAALTLPLLRHYGYPMRTKALAAEHVESPCASS